jgi:predicted nucleic acid-binding protein
MKMCVAAIALANITKALDAIHIATALAVGIETCSS